MKDWFSNETVTKGMIREWEENNRLIDFKRVLIRRKKTREIKDTGQRCKQNLKANLSQFVGIPNTLADRCYNEQSCWETPYKRVL